MNNETVAAIFALMGSIAVLLSAGHLCALARRPANHRAALPPKVATLDLLQPAPVERDSDGWWSHPGVPDFHEGQVAEYKAWLLAQSLEISYSSLEEEDLDHPAYVSYYDQDSASIAGWNPSPPAGDGWFTISIHDTEDGPYWVWARRVAQVVAP